MPPSEPRIGRRRDGYRRRLGSAAVCLGATFAVGVAWARSESKQDYVQWRQPRNPGYREVAIRSRDGVLAVEAARRWATSEGGGITKVDDAGLHWYSSPAQRPSDYRSFEYLWKGIPIGGLRQPIEVVRTGFYGVGDPPPVPPIGTVVDVWVPYGALFTPAAAASYLTVRLAWRRRSRPGRCRRCGYDLRESPSRCPECGTAGLTSSGAGRSL